MGVFSSLRLGGMLAACGRRRPAEKLPPTVCPISGKEGECPVANQARGAAAAPEIKAACADGTGAGGTVADPASIAAAAEHKERGSEHYRKGEFQEAVDAYGEALLLTPRDPSLWLNRSIANRQLKNWEDARDEAEIAAELQPANAKAHYSRALALQHLGELRKALASCDAGLAAQPDNKALVQLRKELKRALSAPGASSSRPSPAGPQEEEPQGLADASAAQCPASKLKEKDLQEIKEAASKDVYQWKGRNPSQQEREGLKHTMVGMFLNKYRELKATSEAAKKRASPQTDQYDKELKQALQIKGGHQHMERPDHVDLPSSFRQPLGVISLEELVEYGAGNKEGRYILSIYGDLFDVSDRPDKYGPSGPYASLTGKDLTWGLFAGVDTVDYCNRCYDLFKAKDLGKDRLSGLYSWLAWYESEYGEPVGRLEPYTHEEALPAPPLQEMEEACAVM